MSILSLPPGLAGPPTTAGQLTARGVAAMARALLDGGVPASDRERFDVMRALEELKSAATAVQASVALAVDTAARAAQARAGVPKPRRARDVPVLLGLALRESPARARSFLGAARAWHTEMPRTLAALREGRLTAWRATVMVRETAHLPVGERRRVDEEVCGDPGALEGVGTAELTARVRRRAAELDPAAAAARARRVAAERAVWVRPAPDTMTYVTALLPVAQGVGVFAALKAAADAARMRGDERSRGQVMADTLVERVTGQASADAVPVAVNLVVSDATLLGADAEPALVVDGAGAGGPVPAQVARNLVAAGLDADSVWLRRLYADPAGNLVAASSASRFFAEGLADLLRVRDQGLCRTPYCDAPIRHLDHVVPAGRGGPTEAKNGQGLCEACNLAKNAGTLRQVTVREAGLPGEPRGPARRPGRQGGRGRHTVVTTTPTGHDDVSTAPPPPRTAEITAARPRSADVATRRPRHRRRRPARSPVEGAFAARLASPGERVPTVGA